MALFPLVGSSSHASTLAVLETVPTDADFVSTPPDGTVVISTVDPVRPHLYGRTGGAWQDLTEPVA